MRVTIIIAVVLVLSAIGWVVFGEQESQEATALVAASAVISAAIFSAVITQRQMKQREIEESHRIRKIEVYESFADLYYSTLKTAKIENPKELQREQSKVVEQMFEFTKRAMLWASPEVLLAYEGFRESGQNDEPGAEVLLRVDEVLKCMRNDLGLSNSNLGTGTFIKLFLTDPQTVDTYIRENRSK